MLEDLDALGGKLRELASRMHQVRDENQELRAQLAAAHRELELMRNRVAQATARVDALLEQMPSPQADATKGARPR